MLSRKLTKLLTSTILSWHTALNDDISVLDIISSTALFPTPSLILQFNAG
jgi:hypothetical protein